MFSLLGLRLCRIYNKEGVICSPHFEVVNATNRQCSSNEMRNKALWKCSYHSGSADICWCFYSVLLGSKRERALQKEAFSPILADSIIILSWRQRHFARGLHLLSIFHHVLVYLLSHCSVLQLCFSVSNLCCIDKGISVRGWGAGRHQQKEI